MNKQWASKFKLHAGCFLCGYDRNSAALHFAHIDASTKYRTRSGKIVHPADMIKGDRYGLKTLQNEVKKCIVLCANCHAEQTFPES